MQYQVVIRIPITDNDIKEAKENYPHLSVYTALKMQLEEEQRLGEAEGFGGVATLEEV
jgi:hypothetical protein